MREIREIISNEKRVKKFNDYFRPVKTRFERFYERKLKYSTYVVSERLKLLKFVEFG